MARKKVVTEMPERPNRFRPATSSEERENQLIALAYDLVEERLRNGTATAQETTQLLKLGSMKTKLELQKLENENKLLNAKTDTLEAARRSDEMYEKALKAMKTYSGLVDSEVYDDPHIL